MGSSPLKWSVVASLSLGPIALAVDPPVTRTIDGLTYSAIDYTWVDARSNSSGNYNIRERLYVPDNLNPNVSHPLVVFFHGQGEEGTNNTNQVNGNIDNLLKAARANGFIVLMPQAPTGWGNDLIEMESNVIARAMKDYNVDPNRVYATGLSLGGAAVQQIMTVDPNQYAAFVPLSAANSMTAAQAQTAVGKPFWFFHGRQDTTVNVGNTENTVKAIAADAGYPAPVYLPHSNTTTNYQYDAGTLHYTEYANTGHDNNTWNNGAYNTPAMYSWMLQQHTNLSTLAPSKSLSINFATATGVLTPNQAITDSAGNTWNNLTRYGEETTLDFAIGYARATDGTITTVSMAVNKTFYAHGTSTVPTGITAIADPTIANGWWETPKGGTSEIEFYNLIAGNKYALTLFASSTATNVLTTYSVGTTTATLNPTNNLTQVAVLNNLTAALDGSLTLDIAAANANNYGFVNTITLTALPVPEPAVACGLIGGAVLLLRSRKSRRFTSAG